MRTMWSQVAGESLAVLLGLLLPATGATQTFSSGSTGADGPFNPTSNTTLPLPPTGIFNFTTITIPAGVTVTFTRNAANTPVILLATGNVTIAGTVTVSGSAGLPFGRPGPGGAGGFDGGPGADYPTTSYGGGGLGPGGGGIAVYSAGGGGGDASAGSNGACSPSLYYNCTTFAPGGVAYGSNLLRPIIGGAGGGGGYSDYGYGGAGGGGGGAILIASSGTLTVTGSLLADGGTGGTGRTNGGGGAGGAIRLIANTITGTGPTLRAAGAGSGGGGGTGGDGRIRLEAYTLTLSPSGGTSPSPTNAYPQPVFPPTGQPSLAIASVGGVAAPAAPTGTYLDPPDVVLPSGTTNPVEVALIASNIPVGTVIQVTATPQSGSRTTGTSTGLSGSLASSAATASLSLSLTQTSVLTATATYPLVASAGPGPVYAEGPVPSRVEGPVPSIVEGDEVTHVKVTAVFGGRSTITYITRSGREIAVP